MYPKGPYKRAKLCTFPRGTSIIWIQWLLLATVFLCDNNSIKRIKSQQLSFSHGSTVYIDFIKRTQETGRSGIQQIDGSSESGLERSKASSSQKR